jgi:hypothetical protein
MGLFAIIYVAYVYYEKNKKPSENKNKPTV